MVDLTTMAKKQGAARDMIPAIGAALPLCLIAETAHATGGNSNDVGTMMVNAALEISQYAPFISYLAYFSAIGFTISAILKMVDLTERGSQTTVAEVLLRFLAAGLLLVIPYVLYTFQETFGIDPDTAQAGYNMNRASGTPQGLDHMLTNFMAVIEQPARFLLSAICYLFGICFGFIGILRLTKSANDGPRAPTGSGTLMTFFTAAVMLSMGGMMDTFTATLFNSATTTNFSALSVTDGDPDALARANAGIQALFAFTQMVGWIAFIRGWFVLRSVAEGNTNNSMAGGFTHIFGGALAANMAQVVRAVESTIGIDIIQ